MGVSQGFKKMLGKLPFSQPRGAAQAMRAEQKLWSDERQATLRNIKNPATGKKYGELPGAPQNFSASGNLPKKP